MSKPCVSGTNRKSIYSRGMRIFAVSFGRFTKKSHYGRPNTTRTKLNRTLTWSLRIIFEYHLINLEISFQMGLDTLEGIHIPYFVHIIIIKITLLEYSTICIYRCYCSEPALSDIRLQRKTRLIFTCRRNTDFGCGYLDVKGAQGQILCEINAYQVREIEMAIKN